MMVCDISLYPVSPLIFQQDNCLIEPPIISTGGDALNVAVGLARLGIPVSIAGRVGKDSNGTFIKQSALNSGIDTSSIIVDEHFPTAVSYVLIDNDKERHFLTNNKIFSRINAKDVPIEMIEKSDIVYLGSAMAMDSMDDSGIEKIFSQARSMGKTTVLDTAISNARPINWLERLEGALQNTDFFLPSLDEAKLLTGKDEPREIAASLGHFKFKALAIKLGKKGCYITDFHREGIVSSLDNMPVKDTTGAGDSFVAGFICGVTQGWDIFECAAFANSIASQNVGAIGATNGIPDFESAQSFFDAHKGEMKRTEGAFKINSKR
jgi:sugar/nucleoside kinase (ribokinase family)